MVAGLHVGTVVPTYEGLDPVAAGRHHRGDGRTLVWRGKFYYFVTFGTGD